MSERTCPVAGCCRALGTTRNGAPYLLCPSHYARLDNPHRLRLWTAYSSWQRIERRILRLRSDHEAIPPALLDARAESVKHYIEIRDDCIEMAGRGESQQLEIAQ